jgi:ribosomal protein S18 acetylase RimI-like enzyme
MLRLDEHRTYTELSSFVVDSEHQGRGIGREMLSRVIHCTSQPIWLQVQQDNPAQHLYQRHGFQRCNVARGRYQMRLA